MHPLKPTCVLKQAFFKDFFLAFFPDVENWGGGSGDGGLDNTRWCSGNHAGNQIQASTMKNVCCINSVHLAIFLVPRGKFKSGSFF